MPQPNQKCESCEHWIESDLLEDQLNDIGVCHRFPHKEKTHHDHWCAEYKKIKDT